MRDSYRLDFYLHTMTIRAISSYVVRFRLFFFCFSSHHSNSIIFHACRVHDLWLLWPYRPSQFSTQTQWDKQKQYLHTARKKTGCLRECTKYTQGIRVFTAGTTVWIKAAGSGVGLLKKMNSVWKRRQVERIWTFIFSLVASSFCATKLWPDFIVSNCDRCIEKEMRPELVQKVTAS